MSKVTEKDVCAKKPIFVQVYDRLYDMVTDGTYAVGHALPPEPKLAEMLEVSRETLRKALLLLQEDGLLKKVKGKGNFVLDTNKPGVSSLDVMGNPVRKCIQVPLDDEVEIEIHLQGVSDYERKLFKRDSSAAIAVDRWYRSQGKVVAYSLTLAPIESVIDMNLDLSNKEEILDFLNRKVYEIAQRSHIQIKTTWVGDFISDRYVLNKEGELSLIQENLYMENEFTLLIHNKHYIVPELCSIEINAWKNK